MWRDWSPRLEHLQCFWRLEVEVGTAGGLKTSGARDAKVWIGKSKVARESKR